MQTSSIDRLEHVSVGVLQRHPKNARMHPRQQIRKIAKSIDTFGFVNPVPIADDLTIIAGHGRVEAAPTPNYSRAAGNLPGVSVRALIVQAQIGQKRRAALFGMRPGVARKSG